MQINSSFTSLPVTLPADRDSQGTRQQQEAVRERLNSEANPASTNASLNASVKRVEAAQRSSESRFQRVRGFDELPLQNRTALNAYLATEQQEVATTRNPSQLAGIDVYV